MIDTQPSLQQNMEQQRSSLMAILQQQQKTLRI